MEEPLFSKKDLKKLCLPLLFEQALTLTVGMADTMMIASAGEAAVSGVSLVDMFNTLVISILAALATGGAVVVSQFLGACKRDEACKSARQLVVSSVFITLAITIIIMLFHNGIISLFFGSIEEDVFNNCVIYLMISALSFPFISLYNSCAAIFRSMGNSQITLQVAVVENIINVVGNSIGMYILHAGVAGVAIPSLISRVVAAFILFFMLKNQKHLVYLPKGHFTFDWSLIKRILAIGIPSGVENGIFQLGRVIVVSIIASFGTIQIAANGVSNGLDSMGCIVGQAMNLAMITVIGRCVGTGQESLVRHYTKKLMLITYSYTFILNFIIILFLPAILKLYGLGADTTQLSYTLVMIHDIAAILLWPLSFTLPNMLRACNDVRFTMFISILSMFTFRIFFSLYLGVHLGMGAIGVWIAMILDWVFRIICFVIRYMSGHWKKAAQLA